MELLEDNIIRAEFLPGSARVKRFEERRGYFLLEVVVEGTGEYRSLRLAADQVSHIELVNQQSAEHSRDPEEFFLFVEAHRLRLAHQFDPMLAVSVSQVDPLPHQIDAVYNYALEAPRLRFLIADDPGAGKTIMAGLILKEMHYRQLARRILIVAPGHLKYQWQRELKEKFGTSFRLIDRNSIRAAWGENVWEENPYAITSIDFLKQDDVRTTLSSARWDLVIVDEAHKMSAYAYETRERTKVDKTKRYQAGEMLSRQTEHMLFLTATPHRGDEENFRLFLDLLRPGFFTNTELLRESVRRGENPIFVRRLKEDMRKFDGSPIFPPRTVQTVPFRMTEAEVDLYNAVTSYVRNYFREELPPKVREADYRRKLELAYPFHPDVIDILYERWGTFPSFQRTRGVLRLLANVVEDLYQSERNLDFILPGDLNLDRYSIRQEFVRHIGPEYESIIGSDIAGVEAKSQILDRQNKSWKHLAQRIATAVFVHSFAADVADKGASLPYVKLAVLRPETIPSLATEILQKQAGELWYLNKRGERYYFSSVPNLNRMIIDKKESVSGGVRAELERRLRRELGTKLHCYLWPRSSDALPDNRELKLAILDPDSSSDFDSLIQWVERRGDGFRVNKNTVFFALPDAGRYARVAEAIKEYLALREIKEEIGGDDRPGMGEKRVEVERRLRDLDDALPQRIRELYRTLAVPSTHGLERIDLGSPTIGRENLDSWYWRELTDETRQKILTRPPSTRMLIAKFLSRGDALNLAAVLEQFYKDTSLAVLAEASILADGIAQGVRNGALGIGSEAKDGIVPSSVQYKEDVWPASVNFSEDMVLLNADRARTLKAEATQYKTEVENGETKHESTEDEDESTKDEDAMRERKDDARVNHLIFRASGIPSSRIADLGRGVFLPLSKEVGEFHFTIEVDLESTEGVPERVIEQQVKETLRQLGANITEGEVGF